MTLVQVQSTKGALAGRVSEWLHAGLPHAPSGIEFTLDLTNRPWSGRDDRMVFTQPDLRFYHGPPDYDVRVLWREGVGHALARRCATSAAIELTHDAARHPEPWLRPFIMPVALVLLRRAGWHHIHAATARDPRGRGWLIAGDTHAGKSTTAALLASRGWSVGTDDTAFLVADTNPVAVTAWREPIALRNGGRSLLARKGGVPLARRHKRGFTPEELGGSWLECTAVDIVALASVGDGATRLTPVPRKTALGELLSWSRFFVLEPALAQQHLELVARLVGHAACYRLTLGADLFARPDLLSELIP